MSCLWGSRNTYPQVTQTQPAGTARRRAHRGAPRLPTSPAGVRAAMQNRSGDDGQGPGSRVPTCSCPLSPGGVEGTSQGTRRPQEQHLALGGWQGGKHFIYFLPSPSFGVSTCFFLQEILLLPSTDGLILSIRDRTPLPTPAQGWAGDQPASLSRGCQLLSSEPQGPQTAGAVASCSANEGQSHCHLSPSASTLCVVTRLKQLSTHAHINAHTHITL